LQLWGRPKKREREQMEGGLVKGGEDGGGRNLRMLKGAGLRKGRLGFAHDQIHGREH